MDVAEKLVKEGLLRVEKRREKRLLSLVINYCTCNYYELVSGIARLYDGIALSLALAVHVSSKFSLRNVSIV